MNRNLLPDARCCGLVYAGVMMLTASVSASPPRKGAPAEKAVSEIRAQVARADRNEKTYRTVERNLDGFSTEGGVLTGWFKGNDIVKMTARYFGESGKTTDEYYLRNGLPIFVLHTDFGYDKLLSGKVTWQEQTRYYWAATGKLVRVLDRSNHLLDVAASETRKPAQELTGFVPKLLALLRGPAKSKDKPDPR